MRTFFSPADTPSRTVNDAAWFPGLPHAAVAVLTWPVFGGPACIAGLLMASLVSFVLWLPLTALALNGGAALAADQAPPAMTANARRALFLLWTATVWLCAAIAR